jgi:hypothetical protein
LAVVLRIRPHSFNLPLLGGKIRAFLRLSLSLISPPKDGRLIRKETGALRLPVKNNFFAFVFAPGAELIFSPAAFFTAKPCWLSGQYLTRHLRGVSGKPSQ